MEDNFVQIIQKSQTNNCNRLIKLNTIFVFDRNDCTKTLKDCARKAKASLNSLTLSLVHKK